MRAYWSRHCGGGGGGDGGDGGGTGTDGGSSGGGTGGTAGTTGGEPEPEAIVCGNVDEPDTEIYDANKAPPTPGCDGAALGPEPDEEIAEGAYERPGPMLETDPAVVGVWTDLVDNQLHLPIHSMHRPTGKFLQFGGHGHGGQSQAEADKMVWYPPEACSPWVVGVENCDVQFDFLPATPEVDTHWEVDNPDDLFCAGHVTLPPKVADEYLRPITAVFGGQFAGAGNNGIQHAWAFSEELPDAGLPAGGDWDWTAMPDMADNRWYPSAVTLPNADTAVLGGLSETGVVCAQGLGLDCGCQCGTADCVYYAIYDDCVCDPNAADDDSCEESGFYNPSIETLLRPDETSFVWQQEGGLLAPNPYSYPLAQVLPDLPHFSTEGWNLGGKVLLAGNESPRIRDARLYDPAGSTVTDIGGVSCTPGSTVVMPRPGKLMKFGGGSSPSRVTEVLDLSDPSDPSPTWRRVASTSMGRRYSSGVLLPDGTALATGGSTFGNSGDDGGEAVFTTELFEADSETWCRLADLPPDPGNPQGYPTYRGYHSQSFLLPDGRVFLGSGGRSSGEDHFDYQLFNPPYLFKGPRPEIDVGGVTVFQTGTDVTFDRANAVPIDRVTLLKLSSSTHNYDMEQRFVELDLVDVTMTDVTATMPPTTCYATPGAYMVFAISDLGVPSVGQYVFVEGDCTASATPADPPVPPTVMEMVNGFGPDGLRASCGPPGSTLRLQDLQRDLGELCAAFGGCPSNDTLDITVTLVDSDSQSVPSQGTWLDDMKVVFARGSIYVNDPLVLYANGAVPGAGSRLGPGRHVLEVCGTFASTGLQACVEQVLHVDGLWAGPDGYGHRAAPIGPSYIPPGRMPAREVLAVGSDGVVTVDLPGGFLFPYYGAHYGQISVGANGGIRLNPGPIGPNNTAWPTTSSNAPDIAVWWDDLDPSAGGEVSVRHFGDRIIVTWDRVPHANALGDAISVQAHLLASGRIELHYRDTFLGDALLDDGASATIGIGNPWNADGLAVSVDDPAFLQAGSALAFDDTTCVASAMGTPDNMACTEAFDLPAVVEASKTCGPPYTARVPVPAVPTICASLPDDAFIYGEVDIPGGSTVPIIAGEVDLPTGMYTARWSVQVPVDGPDGLQYATWLGPAQQTLDVTQTCTLTSTGDGGSDPSKAAR